QARAQTPSPAPAPKAEAPKPSPAAAPAPTSRPGPVAVPAPQAASARAAASAPASAQPSGQPTTPAREGARIHSSPLVRRMAKEHGVDLSGVPGTGAAGRITKEDIEAAIASAAGTANAGAHVPSADPTAQASGTAAVYSEPS